MAYNKDIQSRLKYRSRESSLKFFLASPVRLPFADIDGNASLTGNGESQKKKLSGAPYVSKVSAIDACSPVVLLTAPLCNRKVPTASRNINTKTIIHNFYRAVDGRSPPSICDSGDG